MGTTTTPHITNENTEVQGESVIWSRSRYHQLPSGRVKTEAQSGFRGKDSNHTLYFHSEQGLQNHTNLGSKNSCFTY